ncbi:hypothetical protein AB0436_04035 [Streptomyces sp. NPDC051322]|uniref:hypothetical protein n=1 Tax=Streptomyces sp. NPDC051322 TaxID=3154645 RepID=UPI00344B8E24
MDRNSPLCGGETSSSISPRPLSHLSVQHRVLSAAQLREHGVTAACTSDRCRPGGPWQQLLPGVFVLHPGPLTGEERLHAALLYAGRPPAERTVRVPVQPGPTSAEKAAADNAAAGNAAAAPSAYGSAMVTGLAALALHGFSAAPPLIAVDRIDVLVERTRRLRSTGCARLIRTRALPRPQQVADVPVAPVARALADAVANLSDPDVVRRLLTEAVRGGHCEPAAVVKELTGSQLLTLPHVADAVDALVAEGRAIAEDRLYAMVRSHALPDPLWNVDLRLPGGPQLGGVDAYWPEEAVAVELETSSATPYARKREHLERLGVTVVHIPPRKLRAAPADQAVVVRTALMAAADREPAAYLVVLPRG